MVTRSEFSFNPTLVRLRVKPLGNGLRDPRRFNPTLVRLRGDAALPFWLPKPRFQSHAGSIESRPWCGRANGKASFNPTLVRLRDDVDHSDLGPYIRFNPTLVRLRAVPDRLDVEGIVRVSIPRWFD